MDIRLHVLEKITNNFSPDFKIGRGGYGDVYKGVLHDKELIAVKLLHDTVDGLDDKLFKNEVGNLLMVDHPNIVQFLGYCYETQSKYIQYHGENTFGKHIHKILCFEFVEGGSLDKRLKEKSFAPNWSTRYNIIKGICEGLNFLHGRETPIFHLDLKPGNILLDSSMVPKLADFGLSRLFSESHTHVTQKQIGTDKYMPPEYRNGGNISEKNDVFSLGVVMIDIMEGSEGYSLFHEMGRTQFKKEVISKWSSIIEPTSEYRSGQLRQVETCIDTAMSCVYFQRQSRPTIASILATLNNTETGTPSTQLAVVLPSQTIDIKSSLAVTLKKMKAEPNNITNSVANMEQVPNVREASSNVEEPSIIEETEDRETSSYVEEGLIIGRTEEKNKILSILSESSMKEMVILPIYGIGGIGKTTLAQLVFNDIQFSGYSQVWIYVSEQLDLYKIGNSIISQLTKGDSNIANMQVIHNRLRELFADKRILIVLDDLWEKDPCELDKLKVMLRLGRQRSMVIIVTTRDEAIARNICITFKNEPYKLDILTDDMCWTIIKQKADFENQPDRKYLEHIGREIAIKCGGVALASQSLGYLLMSMRTSAEWKSVRNSDVWNSCNSEDASLQTHKVLASLWLSYSHMNRWLQSCFSYCAIFQKGQNIVKYELIHQWIALGLTHPSDMFDSMQICEQYVTKLLGMSFLQHSKTPSNGPEDEYDTTFMMHDLVHDLAKLTLADDVNKNGNAFGSSYQYVSFTARSKPLSSPENIKALHLETDCLETVLPDGIFSSTKNLLVLDIINYPAYHLPTSFGKLRQLGYLHAPMISCESIPMFPKLNYLSLRHSCIKALPDSIGEMKGLMHFDLSGCTQLSKLPASFADLKQLVYLNLSSCSIPISESWGGFTRLRYLNLSNVTRFDHTKVLPSIEVFRKLTKLQYLNLAGCMSMLSEPDINSLLVGFSILYNLEHLDLSDNDKLNSIPESMGNLTKLHMLDLSRCNIHKLPSWMANMVSLKIVYMMIIDVCGSNLILLEPTNPVFMKISKLEKVMSLEEAQSIKLIEKRRMKYLKLEWTVGCHKRFVDDKDLLEVLVPPDNIDHLNISGYTSVTFPTYWLTGSYVKSITLQDLPKCNNLAPLGQLPNLTYLGLHRLDSLEEWSIADSYGCLMFPEMVEFCIRDCPRLRIKPCLPRALSKLSIEASDKIVVSVCERASEPSSSFSSPLSTYLSVTECAVPLHHWKILEHFSAISHLTVKDCSDLSSCSPKGIQLLSSLKSLDLRDYILTELPTWLVELTALQQLTISVPKLEKLNDTTRQVMKGLQSLTLTGCVTMVSLPQWLGELTSLEELRIIECKGLRSLPGSTRQLTKLTTLQIGSNCMGSDELSEMFSSISADTDEVVFMAEESRLSTARRKEIRRFSRHQPAGDTSNKSRINKTVATDVGDLVTSLCAISIESGSITKNLSDPPSDAFSYSTHENMAYKAQVGVKRTRLKALWQLNPGASSSGSRIDSSAAHALNRTDEVDRTSLVSSFPTISIDPGFIFSATKQKSVYPDPPSDAVSHLTHENMVCHRRAGVRRTCRPRQLVPAASSSGSRINNSAALKTTDEVDGKALVSSFSTNTIEPGFTFSATKRLSDPSADVVNQSTHEIVAHKRGAGVRHAWTRRPRQLVAADSATTTNSLDTPSGSRVNGNGTAADALIIPTNTGDTSVEDIIRSFFALSSEPGSATWLDM